MAELNYREAVAYGIAQEMRRDPNLVMLGEDIAAAGGVFKTTVGLVDEFVIELEIVGMDGVERHLRCVDELHLRLTAGFAERIDFHAFPEQL